MSSFYAVQQSRIDRKAREEEQEQTVDDNAEGFVGLQSRFGRRCATDPLEERPKSYRRRAAEQPTVSFFPNALRAKEPVGHSISHAPNGNLLHDEAPKRPLSQIPETAQEPSGEIAQQNHATVEAPIQPQDHLDARAKQQESSDYHLQYQAVVEYIDELQTGDLPLICKDPSLLGHLMGLESATKQSNGFMFRLMQDLINKDLLKAGYPRLPESEVKIE